MHRTLSVILSISILLVTGNASAEPYFETRNDYLINGDPKALASCDLDGDGDLDFAVGADTWTSGNVAIFLNDGEGMFEESGYYFTGLGQTSICAGDLDGDGDADLIVTCSASDWLSVLINNGDGTFADAIRDSIGHAPFQSCVSDIDSDGDLDIVTAVWGLDAVSILINEDGSFSEPIYYLVGRGPSAITVSDFDGDGDDDLAVVNGYSETVSLLTNNGDGIFSEPVDYPVGTSPTAIVAADLDGDDDADLAILNGSYSSVTIYKNVDGYFVERVDWGWGGYGPHSLYAGDVDGDRDLDLAITNGLHEYVTILLNTGTGSFSDLSHILVPTIPTNAVLADISGDGALDLIAIATHLSVFTNLGDGSFVLPDNFLVGNYPVALSTADLDGDGYEDIATVNHDSDDISIIFNNSEGGFGEPISLPAGDAPNTLTIGDLDGDGDHDIVVANYTVGELYVYLNAGGGTFSDASVYATCGYPSSGAYPDKVRTQDIDGDSDEDIIVVCSAMDSIMIFRNDGNADFSEPEKWAAGDSPNCVVPGDYDCDGDCDLYVVNHCYSYLSKYNVTLLLNSGDGTFEIGGSFPGGYYPTNAVSGDFDEDGDLDLAVLDTDEYDILILANDGSGALSHEATYRGGMLPLGAVARDLDGDGHCDLAVSNKHTDNISIFRNRGDGVFEDAENYGTGYSPRGLGAADFDNDGDIDLVTASYASDSVNVLFNCRNTWSLLSPNIFSLPPLAATGGLLYEYDVEVSGNPAPTFLLALSPEGMTINPVSGLIQWTPAQTGQFEVNVVSANGVAPDAVQQFTVDVRRLVAGDFVLWQNYPNPFNPATTIEFYLPTSCEISLNIYNILGQKVADLADGVWLAGMHSVIWNSEGTASGVYFFRLRAGDFSESRKMLLLR
ncbi:MAG: T9SS type A sorting domain-containing protein [Candidatus Zixiibacteriota bacterium]